MKKVNPQAIKQEPETNLRGVPFFYGGRHEPSLPRLARLTAVILGFFIILLIWAALSDVDEITKGQGNIIPSSREQVVQSLEGGILASLEVREGAIVEKGQAIAYLDETRFESSLDESRSRYKANLIKAARLKAEVSSGAFVIPDDVKQDTELVNAEQRLYKSRKERLEQSVKGVTDSLGLYRREEMILQRLVKSGASSEVELIRLKRTISELESKKQELRNEYVVNAREQLAEVNKELEELESVIRARDDALQRAKVVSPVRGIVKNIEVNTIGGVIAPGGKIMDIIPLDDQLIVEAKISPQDIAHIRLNDPALVKITAYDYAIYGGLDGEVILISPDTLQDEIQRDHVYYRVLIRTRRDVLMNKAGKEFQIFPGMVAEVDIKTGSKSILRYLVKPLNRAGEALRER
ncbi:TPA: HlyD family type I secretion periplasmic adaptor subunit [Morganella morganii]|jgi:multidrug efflux pump subunit AcrA (membrane-fusion protein)|uniref:HlyD family type I secretion periplasmic adaptor subunit n=1 Tax=Morganella sp. GD04133 TaxID=2975435 RepID=UPI001C40ED56|nr:MULTISPECIES: HlyD family type I secretion periplasmic adaptor subunit [Morganella]ELA9089391.1 HlyD family type I secretion periplasmic adaptor subunit [Morganella morganii]MCU6377330.1 HlyD family type I secretion periplasmic adaptor subunit [Morganella morganii]MDH0356081.1 HlyD family type I secretion periplasmic adaptor subunit [Morganella sp. GD04133]HBH7054171.1 HlyD family type I secretion periplasmic adaptor subunit [Morganella morganii]HED3889565.1 HlyD family type I secretion per